MIGVLKCVTNNRCPPTLRKLEGFAATTASVAFGLSGLNVVAAKFGLLSLQICNCLVI